MFTLVSANLTGANGECRQMSHGMADGGCGWRIV
jgi:hypothetical protein